MKTKSLLATIGVCLTILSSASVLITVVVVLDNRELRREIRTLHTDLHQARVDASQLREETTDATERLAAKQSDLLELEKELTRPKASDAKASDAAAASTAPRAQRVRTYLGNQYIGMSWLVPSAVSKEPESGQISYEPVLVLDESLRRNLAVDKTNAVEREVSHETTVNYNYAYPYYYPVFLWAGINRPPNCDTNRIAVQPKPQPQLPSGIFNPVNAKPFLPTKPFLPKEKPLLPAFNQVRTEPIRVQANLAPNVGALYPRVMGAADPQRKATQPWLPPGP